MTLDRFGIKKLYESIPGGREFFMPEIDIPPVDGVNRIEGTEMVVRGNGSVNPNGIWYVMKGSSPRLYVYKPSGIWSWEQLHWHDVEMTCYYHRHRTEDNVVGVSMGAIGWHHLAKDDRPEAYTYYLKHHFDSGIFTLQKEWKHGVTGQDYVVYEPEQPDKPLENDKWYGLKFVVRNVGVNLGEWLRRNGFDGSRGIRSIMSDLSVSNLKQLLESRLTGIHPTGGFVQLEGYLDETDGKDGGDWKKVIELEDDHKWGWGEPWNYGPSCFFRSDNVKDFFINRCSIRTIKKTWWIMRKT